MINAKNFFVSIEYKYLGVTTSDEKGYLLSGGFSGWTERESFDPIWKLTCATIQECKWSKLEQSPKVGRSGGVAMLISLNPYLNWLVEQRNEVGNIT